MTEIQTRHGNCKLRTLVVVACVCLRGLASIAADDRKPGAPKPLVEFKSRQWVHRVAFSPDAKSIAAEYGSRAVGVWSVGTSKLSCTLGDRDDSACSMTWSPDGRLLAVGTDNGACEIWNVNRRKLTRLIKHPCAKGYTERVGSVAFFPDGKTIVTGSPDGRVIRWDATTGKVLASLNLDKLPPSGCSPMSLACCADGRRVAIGCNGGQTILWDSVGGEIVRTQQNVQFITYAACIGKPGMLIAAGGERPHPTLARVTFWRVDRERATQVRSERLKEPPVARLAEGRLYVLHDYQPWPNVDAPRVGEIQVWDARKAQKLATHRLREGVLKRDRRRFFSPDARLLAVVEQDSATIRIWRVADIVQPDGSVEPALRAPKPR